MAGKFTRGNENAMCDFARLHNLEIISKHIRAARLERFWNFLHKLIGGANASDECAYERDGLLRCVKQYEPKDLGAYDAMYQAITQAAPLDLKVVSRWVKVEVRAIQDSEH